ncbi:MAG: DUF418 domain-containing protein, partial [Gemmatimonadetes bacterium]|nr:DUF418 domain-containing protein [Gemmatimonadota bacterium]
MKHNTCRPTRFRDDRQPQRVPEANPTGRKDPVAGSAARIRVAGHSDHEHPIVLFIGLSMGYIPPDSVSEMMNDWKPSAELVQEEVTAYRSGWLKQMEKRVGTAFFLQTGLFLMWGFWRAGGLMLVGMALFKWGVLTAARSSRFYFGLAAAGLALGWTLSSYGLVHNFARNWSLDCQFIGSQYNYWGSIPVSMGYLSLVMLICKSDLGGRLLQSISAVGRTALSNYL